MKKILVPISFSESSKNALRQAYLLSKQIGGRISLLHCYPVLEYAREHSFGNENYDTGIRMMMREFCHESLNTTDKSVPNLITYAGNVSDVLPKMSAQYDLLIMSRKKGTELKSKNWFHDKILFLTIRSTCPVLLTTASRDISFPDIQTIWHIQRMENEPDLLNEKLPKLGLTPKIVVMKSFQQQSFVSEFWKKIVAFSRNPDTVLLADIAEAFQQEHIDLITLINHRKGLFESFVKSDAFQLTCRFDIPILVL